MYAYNCVQLDHIHNNKESPAQLVNTNMNRLKKKPFREKFSNTRKTSIKRRNFFLQKLNQKKAFALERTQKVLLVRCFSLVFDNSKTRLKERRFKKKFSDMQKISTKRRIFFLQKLN